MDYLLRAPKDERVVIGYRHERGENTYTATFEGLISNLERRYRETESEYVKTELEKFMVSRPCPTCGGKQLQPGPLAVKIDKRSISDVAELSVTEALRLGRPACRRSSTIGSGRSPASCSRRSPAGSASSSTSASTT